jgi:hypothetical protein
MTPEITTAGPTPVTPVRMTLTGKTQKGKNRVRELGSEWILVRTEDRVLFNPERGPWWLIEPTCHANPVDKQRWVHSKHDVNFIVEAHAN